MNIPSIIIAALIAIVCVSILARGVYNRIHHRSGCGCGCENCPGHDLCHPKS